MSDHEAEGWPCHFSAEVERLLTDPCTDPNLFSAVVTLTVLINETKGEVRGHTAAERWPEQRRIPLGKDGALGVAEYVVIAYADPPHCVLTRVQPY